MTILNSVRLSTTGRRESKRCHAMLDASAVGRNCVAGRCSGVHAESRVQHGSQQREWLVNEDFENRIQQLMFHNAPRIYICVLKINTQLEKNT